MPVAWWQTEKTISPVAMTVLAQSIDPTNRDELDWDVFFPRQNVGSVDLQSITATENRFVSDRREWGARGRRIPELTPVVKPVSIIPIEANKAINEYEMQKLSEAASTNQEIFRRMVGVSIPDRVKNCTRANYRRVQLDCDTAWSTGIITQKNPETGVTFAATQLSDATRYLTAGTAWDNGAVNAYDLFLAWVAAARAKVGPIVGARTKLNVFLAILADAPDLPNGVLMSRQLLPQRIEADLGFPFQFSLTDRSGEVFTDGGTSTTTTQYWPAGRIAAIPAGGQVGYTAFAPVKRAQDMVSAVGPAPGIDVNGMTVYYEESNGGRQLDIEVQANALPVLDPNKVYVTNTGIA
jgi:hypothetical protein